MYVVLLFNTLCLSGSGSGNGSGSGGGSSGSTKVLKCVYPRREKSLLK